MSYHNPVDWKFWIIITMASLLIIASLVRRSMADEIDNYIRGLDLSENAQIEIVYRKPNNTQILVIKDINHTYLKNVSSTISRSTTIPNKTNKIHQPTVIPKKPNKIYQLGQADNE